MIPETFTGTAWCYGDNINTDIIYPGSYLTITKPEEMAKYALIGVDPKFGENVKTGDIIIAGENFGSGSSREQAAMCLKFAGVSAIIAKSFARIFYRNAINQGIYTVRSSMASSIVNHGDKIEVNIQNGTIKNITTGKTCDFEPLPEFLLDIISEGGIIPYLKKANDK